MAGTGPFGTFKAFLYGVIYRSPKSNRVVVDTADLTATDRVLDIGCGAGSALSYAAEIVTVGRLAGVDPTPGLAEQAARRVPQARIEIGGVEAMPFEDDAFSLAWSISAFHHWPDQVGGLAQVRRVLEPGGRFLLVERLLGDRGAHGLDEGGVVIATGHLHEAGFDSVERADVAVGRKTFAILTAS